MIRGIMGLILILAYLIVAIGSLFVLRVAVCWFWDFDFVNWIKDKENNGKSKEQ